MSTYKLTIPRNISELEDHLGWMVLAGPSFRFEAPGRDANAAFEELRLGLENVLLPGSKVDALQVMSQNLRAFCDANNLPAYVHLLEEMLEHLHGLETLH